MAAKQFERGILDSHELPVRLGLDSRPDLALVVRAELRPDAHAPLFHVNGRHLSDPDASPANDITLSQPLCILQVNMEVLRVTRLAPRQDTSPCRENETCRHVLP